jgi:hypothetical protein
MLGYVLIRQLGGPLRYLDPLFVLTPSIEADDANDTPGLGQRLVGSMAAWGLFGTACLALAVWRLRPAYQRQLESSGGLRQPGGRNRRPPVSENVIRWREAHVVGLTSLRALRLLPRWLALLVLFGVSCLSSSLILFEHASYPSASSSGYAPGSFSPAVSSAFLLQALVVMLLASLVVGVRCSGAIVGEREKQTWEALLMTPLTARELVRGKLSGVMAASYPYLAAYAVPAIVCSALTVSAAIFWTMAGLLMTMLAMYFLGSVGLACSVRAKTSWRSLIATWGFGYVGGAVAYACTGPLLMIVLIPISVTMMLLGDWLPTASGRLGPFRTDDVIFVTFIVVACVALACVYLLLARYCLTSAQNWIAQRERIRYWEPEKRRPPRVLRPQMPLPR